MSDVGLRYDLLATITSPGKLGDALWAGKCRVDGRERFAAWAEPVRSAGAMEIQSELAARLLAAGLNEPEKRSFWPHVTIARARTWPAWRSAICTTRPTRAPVAR